MAFCEFSSEVISRNAVSVDNIFITEFLPNASENCVKVYLYGLYKCSSSKDNTLEGFASALQMSKEDIISIFYYWQDIGLVQLLETTPLQVRYLPVKNALQSMKKYNVDKYAAFNMTAQELFDNNQRKECGRSDRILSEQNVPTSRRNKRKLWSVYGRRLLFYRNGYRRKKRRNCTYYKRLIRKRPYSSTCK